MFGGNFVPFFCAYFQYEREEPLDVVQKDGAIPTSDRRPDSYIE
ncbi:hypothetical protein AM1_1208 [Acaryochloris marina MBIC11017]|uniref:Uncharacterized protein n=1 Tax=Acaryochloris marina (strain MBIC 11017) TaxID=329726 RepID=B0C3Y5_ACAM1|nr:hypothetical protein AM1_1208 [Acaryochloris marina MBIC11017]